jgi:cytochrome bd-type quinol oxidase subunit 2
MLLALILRAVGFEFRSKMPQTWWRKTADQFIFWGSLLPALLWGVAFTNIVQGLPIGADMNFTGNLISSTKPLCPAWAVLWYRIDFLLCTALFSKPAYYGQTKRTR